MLLLEVGDDPDGASDDEKDDQHAEGEGQNIVGAVGAAAQMQEEHEVDADLREGKYDQSDRDARGQRLCSTRSRVSSAERNPTVSGIPGCSVTRNTNLIGRSPKRSQSCPRVDSWPTHSSTTTHSMRFMSGRADRSGVGAWSNTPRWPLNSIDVFDATILRPWEPLPAGL
jgi:hypothetical protein